MSKQKQRYFQSAQLIVSRPFDDTVDYDGEVMIEYATKPGDCDFTSRREVWLARITMNQEPLINDGFREFVLPTLKVLCRRHADTYTDEPALSVYLTTIKQLARYLAHKRDLNKLQATIRRMNDTQLCLLVEQMCALFVGPGGAAAAVPEQEKVFTHLPSMVGNQQAIALHNEGHHFLTPQQILQMDLT